MTDHFPWISHPKRANKAGTGAYAAKQIASKLDKIPHSVYVEPFVGRGDVWRAKQPSGREILNDLDCRRTAQTKKVACLTRERESCGRLQSATVSCGKDWRKLLRHDSSKTLFFLDPPWEKVSANKMNYAQNKVITASEVARTAAKLKGAAAIYYKDTPELRRVLCKKPFKCHTITGNILGDKYTKILAVKKSK